MNSTDIYLVRNMLSTFKSGFTIVIFIHYKPPIAVAILYL